MRPIARSIVSIDLITTKEELGELAKLGAYLNTDVRITAADGETRGSKVILESREAQFIETEIASLVAICSLVRDDSVDQVFAAVRAMLQSWGYPLDGRPSDSRPLGAGFDTDSETD